MAPTPGGALCQPMRFNEHGLIEVWLSSYEGRIEAFNMSNLDLYIGFL